MLSAIVVALSFAACGGEDETTAPAGAPGAPATYVAHKLEGEFVRVGKIEDVRCQQGLSDLFLCHGRVRIPNGGLVQFNWLAVYEPRKGPSVRFEGNGTGSSPSRSCSYPAQARSCINEVLKHGKEA